MRLISFTDGRSLVSKFLGECGLEQAYLVQDAGFYEDVGPRYRLAGVYPRCRIRSSVVCGRRWAYDGRWVRHRRPGASRCREALALPRPHILTILEQLFALVAWIRSFLTRALRRLAKLLASLTFCIARHRQEL